MPIFQTTHILPLVLVTAENPVTVDCSNTRMTGWPGSGKVKWCVYFVTISTQYM